MTINQVEETRYNVRARVPNFLDVFQDWKERSARFRAHAPMKTDIRYGLGDKATFDLFLPPTHDPKHPLAVHLFIHGGYWQAMDKNDFSYIAEPFVQENIATVIVNYDLCPDVSLSEIVTQIQQALIWICQQGPDIGLDPENIHLSGHSAGGHLLGMLLATDWDGFAIAKPSIKSATALSGLFDLVPLVQTTINEKVGMTVNEAKDLSPYGKTCTLTCPVLAVYGELEGDGFALQSNKMVQHWQDQGLPAHSHPLPNATHFDACDTLADPASPVFQRIVDLSKR